MAYSAQKVLMIIQNRSVPDDIRVWAEALALQEQGYQVCIICPCGVSIDTQAYSKLADMHIYRYRLPPLANNCLGYLLEYALSLLQIWWLSLRVRRRHGFDILHAGNPPDFFFVLAWFYRLWGTRFIFDQHDLVPELFLVKFNNKHRWLHALLRWMECRSYRTSDLVLTTNEAQRDFAIARGRCHPRRVLVVRNGPMLDLFTRVPAEPALKNGARYLLIYLGKMESQDGIDYALHALHYLIYTLGYHSVSLTLLGDGAHLPQLKQLAHDLDLDHAIHFAGWVGRQEITRYLSSADIGLCPEPRDGLNEHCTTIKSMEYMAMSLPVVAFDLKEARYTLGEAALYAQPNQIADFARQIARLLDDAELRRTMGQQAHQRVERELHWGIARGNLLRAYEMLGKYEI